MTVAAEVRQLFVDPVDDEVGGPVGSDVGCRALTSSMRVILGLAGVSITTVIDLVV